MKLTALLLVGSGGALGAMARYALTVVMARQGHVLPLGTLLSNLAGCFLLGVVLQRLAEVDWIDGTLLAHEPYRLLFAVGFCGSFTTLSALVYETGALASASELPQAAIYLLLSVVGGFTCFYAGAWLVRALLPAA